MKIFCSKSVPGFYVEGISVMPDDVAEISESYWRELLEGQSVGQIIDFSQTPPVLTDYIRTEADDIAEAEAKKSELRLLADESIAPLEDGEKIGMATDAELNQLHAWRKFRVLLNRVDTSIAPDIEWPTLPA
ncbi:tail fiber assembly protein [Pantoea sp. UBA6567]|uniref:tail fiber assembly protein n=1 Tax=Pantoea sp. UBA6567 TaxID=1947043 RepID=UPI0025970F5F|nr:tail fiber assembly protein [Pantoea sp. UBA6567]